MAEAPGGREIFVVGVHFVDKLGYSAVKIHKRVRVSASISSVAIGRVKIDEIYKAKSVKILLLCYHGFVHSV